MLALVHATRRSVGGLAAVAARGGATAPMMNQVGGDTILGHAVETEILGIEVIFNEFLFVFNILFFMVCCDGF